MLSIQAFALSWSLVQRSPNECGVSEFEREALLRGGPGLLGVVPPWRKGI